MARGRRKDSTPSMEREVPVKLSDTQIMSKCRELTTKLTTVKGLKRNLSAGTRRAKDEIKQFEGEVEQLRQEISDGFELLPQGSLFAQAEIMGDDGKLPKDQAAAALAEVAKAAGEAPKEPSPSEPHEFKAVDALDGEAGKPCSTGTSATWCPLHGDCRCKREEGETLAASDPRCPLHGEDSPHPEPAATQFYAPGSVYAITPSTEDLARRVAAGERPRPVERFELKALKPSPASGDGPRCDESGTSCPADLHTTACVSQAIEDSVPDDDEEV